MTPGNVATSPEIVSLLCIPVHISPDARVQAGQDCTPVPLAGCQLGTQAPDLPDRLFAKPPKYRQKLPSREIWPPGGEGGR